MKLFISLIFTTIIAYMWITKDPRSWRRRLTGGILKAYLIILLVVIPQIISFIYFPIPNNILDPVLVTIGTVSFILGFILLIWARITMGQLWGPPGQHDMSYQKKLITTGPFRYSRNPIYLGAFLLLFGFSLILRSIFFFLPIIHLIYFKKQVKKEEKILKKIFGKEYEKYCEKVKRFI